MLTFGPVSSLFDFLKFGLMIGVLHAGPAEFRTGWFVESLATQTLFVFAIRTRRVPFLRSRPGGLLTATTFSVIVIVIGIALTLVPIGHAVGFTPLPWQFFVALLMFVNTYLVLVEVTKKIFYADREIDGIPLNNLIDHLAGFHGILGLQRTSAHEALRDRRPRQATMEGTLA